MADESRSAGGIRPLPYPRPANGPHTYLTMIRLMMGDGRSVPYRRFKGVFMKSAVLAAVAFASLTCVVSPASALVLLDQHDAIVSESTPVAISFYAGATSTSVSFAGYDVQALNI